PRPRRTILLGLWGGEEQGINGSRRFAADHPEVVAGLQALLNQDTGTGRVSRISAQGLLHAGDHLDRWLARVPDEITRHIELAAPDLPSAGSSDHAAFICAGAPAFHLTSVDWGYGLHTWHTNRDTFDKIVLEEVRSNAVLIAMLAYLASEDPDRVPRDRRELPPGPQGQAPQWPTCQPGQAAW
ncbi:MAG TPA: M28 family peptidase, partial [Longimicrobiaceae bacterium]|nr:M28 family peptidase [Longimicrobiaceae bacterium]